jgi:spore maturation protein CgeB
VLLAYDQGEVENCSLGFKDMHNLVLYRSVAELREKLALLRADQQLVQRIADNGRHLAEQEFSFRAVGHKVAQAMRAPLREPQQGASWLRWFGLA